MRQLSATGHRPSARRPPPTNDRLASTDPRVIRARIVGAQSTYVSSDRLPDSVTIAANGRVVAAQLRASSMRWLLVSSPPSMQLA